MAGINALAMVTTIPTTTLVMTLSRGTEKTAVSRPMVAFIIFIIGTERSSPKTMPRSEPASPIKKASIKMRRVTCHLVRPTARNMPISRVRSTTVMEKVLKTR